MRRPAPIPLPPRETGLRAGMTLIELLAVVAVISLLVSLLMPAVQQSRESARRTACRNNLRQLGLAMQNHEATFGRFPSNGWGFDWVGDPDRGTDRHQPGGWIYNLLPHVEQSAIRNTAAGLTGAERPRLLAEMTRTPLALMKCPSRPGDQLGPNNSGVIPRNADWTPVVAKTDYAVNEGDFITNTLQGPPTLADGDSPTYPWLDVSKATGVCFLRSQIRFRDLRDGSSMTYMLGEKYVSAEHYTDAGDPGHDQSMYSGVDLDVNRWTLGPPLQDTIFTAPRRFGSAHSGGCQFVMCDGSVRMVSYSIDRVVHRRLGNRRDGSPAEVP